MKKCFLSTKQAKKPDRARSIGLDLLSISISFRYPLNFKFANRDWEIHLSCFWWAAPSPDESKIYIYPMCFPVLDHLN